METKFFTKALSAIASPLMKIAVPKLERNSWIISICQELKINLLKGDFESIYAHTLLAYNLLQKAL
jgi:hypothetical protein